MVFGPTLLAAVLVTFLPTSTNAKIAGDDGILKLTQGNFKTQFPRKLFDQSLAYIFCAGKIQGLPDVSQNGKRHFYKYLGIPYAQPPVGKLRSVFIGIIDYILHNLNACFILHKYLLADL